MKSFFWRITLKLKRKPYWFQIAILFLFSYIIVLSVLPLLFVAETLNSGSDSGPGSLSIISVVIFAPFLETILNQYLPFKFLQTFTWTKNKCGFYVVGSAIIFGLCHCYSIQYIIFAFAVGLILGYTYLFYSNSPKKAFWSTTLIHALRNGMVVLSAYYQNIFN